ncbi:insulinase family protein [Cellulosilyticum sp. I15G10I2]|uniref:insulinase family protein n=1 Tax=Cellulosilyticum sp. I15G10I2 TaxID=1892843 RepID=UPI00085BE87E|nr:insulinase family protein [Cellulosilyticum sp. I15G10I2]
MKLQLGEVYSGFKLTEEKKICELEGVARVFKHQKSGTELIHILNKDDHKVFTITFKTPPEDNSGAAHIIEHVLCCSSKKYPLKDTFIELQNSSLCTALNACTYQDMTMYYCASKNDKDFKNLVEVYTDLIFDPLLEAWPNLFRQEGWHYEIRNKREAINYNGVVYNEMLGEYDDPATILEHTIHQALFPNTIYRYDAGGVPEEIVQFNYEDYIAFYEKYYHPSHACIYLYGDIPILDQLKFLDEHYLMHFDKKADTVQIPLQQRLHTPASVHASYQADDKIDLSEAVFLVLSFVIGTSQDAELRLAFEILEQILLKSSASPLVEALIVNKELGKSLTEAGYDTCKQQPVFSITLKGTSVDNKNEFEQTVFEVLHQLVSYGIDPKLIEASINSIEFALKEADDSFEPRGVMYSEKIQNSFLYGGEPFIHLFYDDLLKKIKEKAYQGYFEALIKKYFIENTHRVLVLLEPSKVLKKEIDKKLAKNLKIYKKGLGREGLEELISINNALDKMQNKVNSKEALKMLPVLTLSDISPKTEAFIIQEQMLNGVSVLFNPDASKDIIYMHLLFDTTGVNEEDIPYLGVLASLLTYVGTKHYNYLELDHAINSCVGGMGCQINAYSDIKDTSHYRPLFKISAKLLKEKLPNFVELMHEILNNTIFMEQSKIKEILGSIKYEMERSFNSNPEYTAIKRIYSYCSHAGMYEDIVAGIAYYDFLCTIYNDFDNNFDLLRAKLSQVFQTVFSKTNMTMSITAEQKDFKFIKASIEALINGLKSEHIKKYQYALTPVVKNEGFVTMGSLYTVAKGFNYKKEGYASHGVLQVICNILESTYLWDKIRLQGGAYGCELSLGLDGNMVICSYCDPHLIETLAIYEGIGPFLSNLSLDDAALHRYIVGTIGGLDCALSMEQRSERALTSYLCGITQSELQKAREEILAAEPKDIQHFAALFNEFAKRNTQCVIGNSDQIKKHQRLFKSLRYLSY